MQESRPRWVGFFYALDVARRQAYLGGTIADNHSQEHISMRNVTEVIKELTEIFGTDVTLELKQDGTWVLRNGVTSVQQTETTPLHKELSPFFYGDDEVTGEFIKRTNGCNDMCVCEILNDYIKRGKVQRRGMKSKMHEILHRYGIYKAKYSNFTIYVH